MEDRRNTSGLDVLLEVWSRHKWLATLVWQEPGDDDPRIAGG